MSSLLARFTPGLPALVVLASLLGACGHEPVRKLPATDEDVPQELPATDGSPQARGAQAAVEAVRQVGVPYRYGGATVNGFDCSGLVQFAYALAGTRIPRTTADQFQQLSPVADRDLQVGDLLFFRIDGGISHVGMYLGSRRFVHAPSTGREVSIAELDSAFYRDTFVRGGRPR